MTRTQMEALITLMTRRAEDASKFPQNALRHLMDAGIVSADGKLRPEYAGEEDCGEGHHLGQP